MVRFLGKAGAAWVVLLVVRSFDPEGVHTDAWWSPGLFSLSIVMLGALIQQIFVLSTRMFPVLNLLIPMAVGLFAPLPAAGWGSTGPQHASVCAVQSEGRPYLAWGGRGHLISILDPVTGEYSQRLGMGGLISIAIDMLLNTESTDPLEASHWPKQRLLPGVVRALCQVQVGPGTIRLASAGDDQVIQIWDPATGKRVSGLHGAPKAIHALAEVRTNDHVLLAAAGDERSILLWDVQRKTAVGILFTTLPWIRALCEVPAADGTVLAAAGAAVGFSRDLVLLDAEQVLGRSESSP